ncbi:hypothetical protein J3R30DRAFT_3511393 [Lentinula aciculospora]|uniref:Uncharacterized protein n=1 Tax=Lentinula aciculospora TaxID=153920 RepID=A0A9W9DKU7_9AGAR|nr:hypothetical protein J3R30DRAFT_3511393 [Lentinula aciculospora]
MLLALRRVHTTTADQLLNLVRSKQYDVATTLLLQTDLSSIPHSRVYETAALHAYSTNNTTAMAKYLSLYPADTEPPNTIISKLLKAQHTEAINHLGIILANKGYTNIVRSKILPILSTLGSSTKVEWALEPEKLDVSSDVFECEDQYDFSSTSTQTTLSAIHTLHDLLSSLSVDSYNAARRLLLDLQSLEHPIPPSTVYLLPASMALSLPLSASERMSDFELWFKHYPPRNLNRSPSFTALLSYLDNSLTSLPLFTSLSLLLAQKGYSSFSNTHLIPSIFRYSNPSQLLTFYHQYESNIRAYSSANIQVSNARSIAVRHLAESGHLSSAVSLLSTKFKFHQRTHSILLSRLLSSSMPNKEIHIQQLRDMAIPSTSRTLSTTSTFLPHTLRQLSKTLASGNIPPTQDLVDFFIAYISLRDDSRGRNALSLLHTHTHRFSPTPYRSISHLLFAHMVLLFRLGSSSSGISSTNSSYTLQPLGSSAHRALLRLFHRFFHIHGISLFSFFNALYDESSEESKFYLTTLTFLPKKNLPKLFPNRLHISLVWQALAYLAPTHQKLGILWEELVKFASPEGLVSDATLQTPKSWTSRGHRIESTTSKWPKQAHPSPIIAECFTPFIVKLMHASVFPSSSNDTNDKSLSSSQLLTPTYILRTLLSLNLSPTIYHYTEMARWWAWRGEESKVWVVLTRLESVAIKGSDTQEDHKVLRALEEENSNQPPPSIPSNSLPPTDFPLYIALMRAFLSSPNYRDQGTLLPPSLAPTIPSINPETPHPLLPPFAATSPYPGTLRRLRALSYLWERMERRFGRSYLLSQLGLSNRTVWRREDGTLSPPNLSADEEHRMNHNPRRGSLHFKKVVSNWRSLAGVSSN